MTSPDDELLAALRQQIVAGLAATPIAWEPTGDGEHPYRARVDGRTWTIRVNDFPAEPLYTLLVAGEAQADLEDWPAAWTKPAAVITASRASRRASDSGSTRSGRARSDTGPP